MAKTPGKKVPARAVALHTFADLPRHETIWAIAAAPDGLIHAAICCEHTGGGTAHLYSYDIARRTARHELDVAKLIREPPENGRAAHGKVHFSLCPSTDGFLYAATHCSTPPLGDKHWDAHAMYNDAQRSFTGGHFFRCRPGTGEARDFGILIPHEGVGVMALDEATGRCVGVTYPSGHLFFVDKDGGGFLDAGRHCEQYTLSLIGDGRGFVYGTDAYGYFLRINMEARSIAHLTSRLPPQRGASGRYAAMSDSLWGPDGWVYAVGYRAPKLFRFRPARSGPIAVEDLGPLSGENALSGLAFGGDGRLYASSWGRLVRYDIRKRKAEDLGLLYAEGAERRYWRCATGNDGKLYGGECGRKPVSLIIIDPEKL